MTPSLRLSPNKSRRALESQTGTRKRAATSQASRPRPRTLADDVVDEAIEEVRRKRAAFTLADLNREAHAQLAKRRAAEERAHEAADLPPHSAQPPRRDDSSTASPTPEPLPEEDSEALDEYDEDQEEDLEEEDDYLPAQQEGQVGGGAEVSIIEDDILN